MIKSRPEQLDGVMDIWLRQLSAHRSTRHTGAAISVWLRMLRRRKSTSLNRRRSLRFIGLAGTLSRDIRGRAAPVKGVRKALLDYVKQTRGALSLRVFEKNARAAQFYMREGFAAVREQVDENTGEEELVMRWTNDEVEI